MARVLWTQKQDIGPRARVGHAMAYDAPRQCITLFGGDTANGAARDTWEWAGENWTQVQDIGPAARALHAMANDAVRGRTVLFGGRTQAGAVGDTWEWDGEHWTQVADSGPSSRFGHVMAFDVAHERILLFGGEDGNGGFLNDTWAWDGTEWVQQEDTGPSPRSGAAMAFDSLRNRTVLFGGAEAGGATVGDTWEWDGTAWTQASDFGPAACARGAMAFTGSGIALYGGIADITPGANTTLFGITWDWNGKHWTARQDMGPGPRLGHALAFDTARGRIVLFGGSTAGPSADGNAGMMSDTWEQIRTVAGTEQPFFITAFYINPTPVAPGQDVTFTVEVSQTAGGGEVGLFIDGDPQPFATVMVGPQETVGSLILPIAPETQPADVMVFARAGTSELSALLSIQ